MLIDGIVLGDHTVLIALGIDDEGKRQILGLRDSHTEHSRVVKALLRDSPIPSIRFRRSGFDRNSWRTRAVEGSPFSSWPSMLELGNA